MRLTNWRYFEQSEVKGLKDELIAKLDEARHLAEIPFVITSGLRLFEKNESVGGIQDSAHLKGLAVDLRAASSAEKFKIVQALLAVGFTRIGIYKDGHIHVDLSKSLPQKVLWLG